jgi:hypothetical protein
MTTHKKSTTKRPNSNKKTNKSNKQEQIENLLGE